MRGVLGTRVVGIRGGMLKGANCVVLLVVLLFGVEGSCSELCFEVGRAAKRKLWVVPPRLRRHFVHGSGYISPISQLSCILN